jgi:hypothetical protein
MKIKYLQQCHIQDAGSSRQVALRHPQNPVPGDASVLASLATRSSSRQISHLDYNPHPIQAASAKKFAEFD